MFKLFFRLSIAGALLLAITYKMFYGGGVRSDVAIALNIRDLERVGAERLVDSLVKPHIKFWSAFEIYADRINLYDRGVIRGYYELNRGMSVVEIVRRLKLGMQTPKRISFNNIRTPEQLAAHLSQQLQADSTELINAINDKSWRDSLGLSKEQRISIFLPNTYEVWWSTSPENLIERMIREYDSFWTQEREAKRKALNMSRAEVVTLASIVIEESREQSEYARIAGVYINRLKRRMRLQADPTVKFALGDPSIKRILTKHLKFDSPYNTYIYRGLPPGAIALPPVAAIDGVLNYEKHNYLYFCAKPEMNGEHNFSESYSDHLKNARAYQDQLDTLEIK